MRRIIILTFIFTQVILNSSSIFAQKDFSKSILTLGISKLEDCGLVDANRRDIKEPEDDISETIRKDIGAKQMGTGFIYSYNGVKYIITCEHVVFKAGTIIGYSSSYEKGYELELLNGDTFFDVAVLKFKNPEDAKQFESIQFETKLPDKDDAVHSFGYWNLDGTQTSFSGKVRENDYSMSDKSQAISKMGFIETTAKLPKGYSGGILSNGRGKVLGMNTMRRKKDDDGIKTYYALQSKIVKRVIENVIDNGRVERAFLGIQFSQNIGGGNVVVNKIMNDTPAEKYRHELIGQNIKSINGKPVKAIYDVLRIMENIRPSTPVTLELDTDSVTMTSEYLNKSRLEQIAEHAVQEHKNDPVIDIEYKGYTISITTDEQQKEVAKTAGIKNELVYCLDGLYQLGIIVRIFGMQRKLKIGTDDLCSAGRWIYFSEDIDKRVLYY